MNRLPSIYSLILLTAVAPSRAQAPQSEGVAPGANKVNSPAMLQGFAEQSDAINLIQSPVDVLPVPAPPICSNQSRTPQPITQSAQLGSLPSSQPVHAPISRNVVGGQDEYGVNWNAWHRKVRNAITPQLEGKLMWPFTRVDYTVTRDGKISITNVSTPDPTGRSGKYMTQAILNLQGDPVLQFPPKSKQTVHATYQSIIGLLPSRHFTTFFTRHEGTEQITQQW